MQLIKDLCHTLSNSNKSIKIIGLIAQDGEQDILSHEENDTLEIGLTKKIYLRIFKESHELFHNSYEDRLNIDSLPQPKLEELYYMTLGYMITTNEHSTVISLHEELVKKLGNYEYDSEIVSCFLTCRMKRINKSSSLWHWLKKVTIIHISNGQDVSLLLHRALVSCELHFANYYGNNYLQWLIIVCKLKGIDLNEFEKMLINSCRANLSDSSLWGSLKMLFNPDDGSVDYVSEEYNRITGLPLQRDISVGYEDKIVEQFQWLLRSQCNYMTPFCKLVDATNSLLTLNKLANSLNDSNLNFASDLRAKLLSRKKYIETNHEI
ncbi:hypothetical protein I9W82_004456 [Candida metapsilosis]|uniref:Uncharacterized protein n=1 Tax=Candida metapsilosis TaxID=273372 RepID=A0A8H7ZGA0_9ASCO|nr:hypothetical protein I9W82_004456 [Candida metapsilosis]